MYCTWRLGLAFFWENNRHVPGRGKIDISDLNVNSVNSKFVLQQLS